MLEHYFETRFTLHRLRRGPSTASPLAKGERVLSVEGAKNSRKITFPTRGYTRSSVEARFLMGSDIPAKPATDALHRQPTPHNQ